MADGRDNSAMNAEPAERIRERLLIQRASRGEEGAFTEIVETYRLEIARLAGRMLGWDPDVEDVVQDVLLSVYMNVSRFHHQCSLRRWLFRITVNRCRTHRLRRMLRWKRFVPAERMGVEPHAEAENRSLADEWDRAVRQAVRGLPARYREPVVLRYLYGMGKLPAGRRENICLLSTGRAGEASKRKWRNRNHLISKRVAKS
jgi:RNA polymerase sigma-70 factor (ECF subfamily)